MTAKSWAKRLEVKHDIDGAYKNDQFINPDLAPMPARRRIWTMSSYALYWLVGGFSIVNYTSGSALIAYGLSGPEAIGCCILGPFLLGLLAVMCGWVGGTHHIGFAVSTRFSWGVYGGYFAIVLRCVAELIWDGIEAYWGGQAVSALIGALSPGWRKNDHMLAGGTLKLTDFIGFIIFYIFFLLTMQIAPEKLQIPFMITTVGFTLTVFGLLIWAVSHTHSAGPYFASGYEPTTIASGNLVWAWWFGAMSILGNFSPTTLAAADWSRFSRDGPKPTMIQFLVCPLVVALVATLGIIVTSCTQEILGEAIWQPYQLLQAIQAKYDDSPRSRAAVFFAGLACACAQVNVNIILNSVSAAMDLSALCPKYVNIKRGAYGIAAIGVAVNPWYLSSSAATFLNVLTGFGIFYGPLSGILCADYWIVRKRVIKLHDLYLGTSDSIYWFTGGFNFRALAAFLIAVVPLLPGYAMGIENKPYTSTVKASKLALLLGFVIAFVAFILINYIWPPAGLGEGEYFHDDLNMDLPTMEKRPASDLGTEDEKTGDVAVQVVDV